MKSPSTAAILLLAAQLLLLAVATCTVESFSPPSQTVRRQQQQESLFMTASAVNPLEEEVNNPNSKDPFDSYEVSQQQTTVAIKDTVPGTGPQVQGEGQLLTVAYKGRFLGDSNRGQFDQSDNFLCRIGTNSVLPGFEEGLKGMRVGGLRTVRIPPNMAYGDEWYKGTIPPSSHLEFELELKNIASSKQEEFQLQLEKFGVGRAIGGVIIVGYLALSPFLGQ